MRNGDEDAKNNEICEINRYSMLFSIPPTQIVFKMYNLIFIGDYLLK